MRGLVSKLAPRNSRRRLLLKMTRDFVLRPSSLTGRLSSVNFHNARVSSALRILCTVCGNHASVSYDYPDIRLRKAHGIGVLRETLACRSCGATMRDRQMATGLIYAVRQRTGDVHSDLSSMRACYPSTLRVLDTDSFSPLNGILRGMSGYAHSQYQPNGLNGEVLPDGSLNVNLEEMPFEDGSFDVILTSDVMEHVQDDERAHREIYRVLAPGGCYVFTIPYDPCLMGTRRLTLPMRGSAGVFFEEKHVHGDPHSSSGILAHRIYGQQVFADLRVVGFEVEFLDLNLPTNGIFGGDLFLATKSA